ncbi:MAG: SDR family oxidoreductase [Deltaproteobacteria bacterium]|nr:SDR family oxidoreductase [Deltaproteobacteria bacterium]
MTLNIDLSEHTALITGATGQLGRVMVKTLAQAGASIAIHFNKNKQSAFEIKESLKDFGVKTCIVQCDVTDLESVMKMKNEVESLIGNPDIVITNAVSQIFPWRTVLEEDIKDYEDQFKSSVMQNVNMAKAFVPHMQRSKWGRFIGINTECTIQTFETQSAYVSGKKGMDGVLRVLAKEIGPYNITVNQIAPGWTVSYKDRENGTEEQPEYSNNIPLRRRGTDQEIANVAAFLASDLASFITGALIPVTGGNAVL